MIRNVKLLVLLKEGWHLCHPCVYIANQSNILPHGQLVWFLHLVTYLVFLLGETLFWSKIGNNMIHHYSYISNSFVTQFFSPPTSVARDDVVPPGLKKKL